MEPGAVSLKGAVKAYAGRAGWRFFEEEEDDDAWTCIFQLPGEEKGESPVAEGAAAPGIPEDAGPDPAAGPPVLATVEQDYLTLTMPIDLSPALVRGSLPDLVMAASSYGLAIDLELPQEDPKSFYLGIGGRIYGAGFCDDVLEAVLASLMGCAGEILELAEARAREGKKRNR